MQFAIILKEAHDRLSHEAVALAPFVICPTRAPLFESFSSIVSIFSLIYNRHHR